jgi:hypothetical protein
MAPTPSGLPLRWAAVLLLMLPVQAQFVNVFAVRDSDRGGCSLIGARKTRRFDTSVIVSEVSAFQPRTPTATGEK